MPEGKKGPDVCRSGGRPLWPREPAERRPCDRTPLGDSRTRRKASVMDPGAWEKRHLVTQNLVSHGRKFVFCSGGHGKPSKGFKQTDDMVSVIKRYSVDIGRWEAGGPKGDLALIPSAYNLWSSSPGLFLHLESIQHAHHLIRKLFLRVKGASPAGGWGWGLAKGGWLLWNAPESVVMDSLLIRWD